MKQALSILKAIGVIVGFSVTLWGVFTGVDAVRDYQQQDSEHNARIQEEVTCGFKEVNQKIDSVLKVVERQGKEISSQTAQFKFYRDNVDRLDREQMEQILQDVYNLGLETGKKKDLTVSERRETPWGIVETVYD